MLLIIGQITAIFLVSLNIYQSLEEKNYHSSLGWILALTIYIITII